MITNALTVLSIDRSANLTHESSAPSCHRRRAVRELRRGSDWKLNDLSEVSSRWNRLVVLSLLLIGLAPATIAADTETVDTDAVPAAVVEPSPDQPLPNPSSQREERPAQEIEEPPVEPWDFSPYRILIWIASDDPSLDSSKVADPLRLYLDRDFGAIWRVQIADAPTSVATAASRNLSGLSYETIAASDPIAAVKRDHDDAIRIRIAQNVGEFVSNVLATPDRIREIKRRAESSGNPSIDGISDRLKATEGDEATLASMWEKPETEALLLTRGMALTLTDPEAKLISLPIDGLVTGVVDQYDKVFVVRVQQTTTPTQVSVVEFDTLMRYFGPVSYGFASGRNDVVQAIGRTITAAFAPTIRIEDAGQKSAKGLLRAGGLIMDENSPALISVEDVLVPMTRKNDRNGKPILIGPLDWAFLLVNKVDGVRSEMDFYSGRAGGLQGRQNKRTFRTALRVRPPGDKTLIRLHAQGDEDFPLIGYEIYERELQSPAMTFIGRTDWNGRMLVEQSENPMRLLYVKNGGAVLARLPIVPGLTEREVADLGSDDMRLQAEAYIRGVQNAIIDLVAIRELFAARVRLRLERGQMKEAEELLNKLRSQPTNEKLSNDMGKKETAFLNLIGPKNPNQYRKVENMFSTTRDMLSKHINPKIINDLEADLIAAERNGGKLERKKDEDAVVGPEPEEKPKKGRKK